MPKTKDAARQLADSPALFRKLLIVPTADQGPKLLDEVAADFQRERFEALDPAFCAVAAGRTPTIQKFFLETTKGTSKTSDLAVCLLWLLAFSPRSLLCQVGAADQDQADELRKAAKDILALNPWLQKLVAIHNWTIISKRIEARAEIVAADIAGSHGARPDVLIIDELSHVTKTDFIDNLLDNAAKIPRCLIIIATNAGVVDSFAWKQRELARTSPAWYHHVYARPAPWISQETLAERQKVTAPSRFNRLWWGVWSDGGGDALPPDVIRAAVNLKLGEMRGDEPGWVFTAGLDIGVRNDHSGFVVIGRDVGYIKRVEIKDDGTEVEAPEGKEAEQDKPPRPRVFEILADLDPDFAPISADSRKYKYVEVRGTGRIRLAYVESWRPEKTGGEVKLQAVEDTILQAHRRFWFSGYYDPSQAEHMAQRLTAVGVPMTAVWSSSANLNLMASELLEQFTSKNIELYDHADLVRDILRLKLIDTNYGQRLDAKRTHDGGHADRGTALLIALLGARKHSLPVSRISPEPLLCWP